MNGQAKNRDWSLAVGAVADGVQIEIGLPDVAGEPFTALLTLDRDEARQLARALLSASGDAIERTFPRPSNPEHD